MDFFIFNHKFYPSETSVINSDNRGLRYGDGLFETIKSINGHIQFLDEHLARLWKGMQVLQFNIPKHFTPDLLEADIYSLLEKNRHAEKARIRVTVFRGDGGLYDVQDQKPNYLIQTWNLATETGSWNSNGLIIGIYDQIKKSCDLLSNLKHNNFLPYVMAANFAKQEKCNDAVLLNTMGRICDTTIANIFLIQDGIIKTPALQEGCIAGIMRNYLITQLKVLNYSIQECQIFKDELYVADEVFLTNSIYNMRWVQTAGKKKYSNHTTQKIFETLFK